MYLSSSTHAEPGLKFFYRQRVNLMALMGSFFHQLTSGVCISQLLANHSGISAVPEVITHCPPPVIDAHLHSTLILIGASHQTNVTISTDTTVVNYRKKMLRCQYANDSKWTTNIE